jgi:hypothetical protein
MSHKASLYVKHLTTAPRACSCPPIERMRLREISGKTVRVPLHVQPHGGQELTPQEKAVLWYLADCHNEDEEKAIPSLKKIATDSCMSVRTAQEHLAALECKGVIHRDSRKRDNGSDTSNRYTFPAIDGQGGMRTTAPPGANDRRGEDANDRTPLGNRPHSPGANDHTPPPATVRTPRTTEKELPSLTGATRKRGEAATSDPRFQGLVEAIAALWKQNAPQVPFEMDPADGVAINRMLERRPKWQLEDLQTCVVFRFASESTNPTQGIRKWIADLTEFASGPRNRFGDPLYGTETLPRLKNEAVAHLDRLMGRAKNPTPAVAQLAFFTPFTEQQQETAKTLWGAIRDNLAKRVNRHSFDTWIKPVKAAGYVDHVLYIRVPTPEFKHIGEKYASELNDASSEMPIGTFRFHTCDEEKELKIA